MVLTGGRGTTPYSITFIIVRIYTYSYTTGLGHFSNGFKGGVHLCSKPGDVTNFASKMLGSNLITKQTTAEGIALSTDRVRVFLE